jgi:hypothetical protein
LSTAKGEEEASKVEEVEGLQEGSKGEGHWLVPLEVDEAVVEAAEEEEAWKGQVHGPKG